MLSQTVVGTALVAGGAAALNQVYERDTDALMRRTRLRPLPDGRVQPREARSSRAALVARWALLTLAIGANLLQRASWRSRRWSSTSSSTRR